MNFSPNFQNLLFTVLFVSTASQFIHAQQSKNSINGNLIQFNNNSLWHWYQDERTVIDMAKNKLIIGSSAYANGFGGSNSAFSSGVYFYTLHVGNSFAQTKRWFS